jgi:hypothetical protein
VSRLTNDDRHFGPITYGRTSWNPIRLVWSSGGDGDCDKTENSLTAYGFGWVCRLRLPNVLQPYRIKHMAKTWDAATVARLGRDWYYETFPREYGFSLSDGFLQLFLGPQTHDSISTKDWCIHLPWTQWRYVRKSLYDPDGTHFWTEWSRQRAKGIDGYAEQRDAKGRVPKVKFTFLDFDRELITVTAHIEEMEWRYGDKWCSFLSLFRPARVRRYLSLEFDKEVGPEKGSWKGGTLGHSIEMLPGESCESAVRRYCDQEHRSKYRTFRLKFVGAP